VTIEGFDCTSKKQNRKISQCATAQAKNNNKNKGHYTHLTQYTKGKGKHTKKTTPEGSPIGEITWGNRASPSSEMREARAHSPYENWNKEGNSGDGSLRNRGIEKNNNSLENEQLLQQRNNNYREEKAKRETNIYSANQLSLHENHVSCSTNPWINNDIIGTIRMHTDAWKIGMAISPHYGGTILVDPKLISLIREKYYNLNSLYY